MNRPFKSSSQLVFAWILLTYHSVHIHAQEQIVYTPAAFHDGEKSIVHKISFPESDDNTLVIIRCDGYAGRHGELGRTFCYSDRETDAEYAKAVLRIVNNFVPVIPATVNGRRVQVYFQFSILFEKINGQASIRAYPHHFLDYEKYGTEYIGPQRYSEPGRFPARACKSGLRLKTWVSMTIDENGVPDSISLLNPETHSDYCHERIQKQLSRWKYIPAFHNGKPVRGSYLEAFFNSDSVVRP